MYTSLVQFLLFVFFKQKTAYEMRISDWSSDVCSSDLPVDCVAFDLEDAVPPQQKAAARRAVSEALTRLDFDRRERIVRINAVGTVHQIGRASCRERVCQYV